MCIYEQYTYDAYMYVFVMNAPTMRVCIYELYTYDAYMYVFVMNAPTMRVCIYELYTYDPYMYVFVITAPTMRVCVHLPNTRTWSVFLNIFLCLLDFLLLKCLFSRLCVEIFTFQLSTHIHIQMYIKRLSSSFTLALCMHMHNEMYT
jgi:hypothetical protein